MFQITTATTKPTGNAKEQQQQQIKIKKIKRDSDKPAELVWTSQKPSGWSHTPAAWC